MLDTPSPICFTGLGRMTGGFVSPRTLHGVSLCESGLCSDVSSMHLVNSTPVRTPQPVQSPL